MSSSSSSSLGISSSALYNPFLDDRSLAQLLCTDPETILSANSLFQIPDRFKEITSNFSECACKQFKRTLYPNFRRALEDSIVAAFERNHPDKTAEIKLISLGSGGCFQELVILSKLLHAGYSKISFTLIDTLYEKSKDTPLYLESFAKKEFSSSYPKATISIDVETDYGQYMKKINNEEIISPHAFLFIDVQSTIIKEDSLLSFGIELFEQNSQIPSDTIVGFTNSCISKNIFKPSLCVDICLTKSEHLIYQKAIDLLIKNIILPLDKTNKMSQMHRTIAKQFICHLITCENGKLQNEQVD